MAQPFRRRAKPPRSGPTSGLERLEKYRYAVSVDGRRFASFCSESRARSAGRSAILQYPALKTLQISGKTYKEVVQLSGFVDSKDMVERAGEVAGGGSGVREVKNDLVVK